MGLGGVAIAVSPYVIHPKTAVLGRAGGGNFGVLDFLNYIKNRVRAHMRPTCVCIL